MSGIPFPFSFFLPDQLLLISKRSAFPVKSLTVRSLIVYMQGTVRTSLMAVTGQVSQAAEHGPKYEVLALRYLQIFLNTCGWGISHRDSTPPPRFCIPGDRTGCCRQARGSREANLPEEGGCIGSVDQPSLQATDSSQVLTLILSLCLSCWRQHRGARHPTIVISVP